MGLPPNEYVDACDYAAGGGGGVEEAAWPEGSTEYLEQGEPGTWARAADQSSCEPLGKGPAIDLS